MSQPFTFYEFSLDPAVLAAFREGAGEGVRLYGTDDAGYWHSPPVGAVAAIQVEGARWGGVEIAEELLRSEPLNCGRFARARLERILAELQAAEGAPERG